MKKILLITLSITTLLVLSGCGSPKASQTAAAQTGQNSLQQSKVSGQSQMSTSQSKLRMKISTLSRLQRSENPLTQEQKDKLIPLLKEISAKVTIDEKYATQKTKEIDAILTDAQKKMSLNRPNEKPNQGSQKPAADASGDQQKQNPLTDGNNPNGGRRMGGQNFGGPNMGVNISMKVICDGIISQLESQKTQTQIPQAQQKQQ